MEAQKTIVDQARTVWAIEPRYTEIQFSVKSFYFFHVKGRFTDFKGEIHLDEHDLRGSSVQASIKADSIQTGNRRRDAHLRSADFLDAEKYPVISFESTRVERGRDRDTLRVTGSLMIKGAPKEIVLNVFETDRSRSPQGEEVAYYTATAEVDRIAFGVAYLRGLIGQKVKVTIPSQATRK
jgi:polyisoprenoid-binding protein YceI